MGVKSCLDFGFLICSCVDMANVVLWCLVCVWVLLFCGCLVFGLFLVPFAFLHALALVHSAQTAVSRAKKSVDMANPACRTAVTMQAPGWPAISSGEMMMVVPIARERPTLARVNASRRLTAAVRSWVSLCWRLRSRRDLRPERNQESTSIWDHGPVASTAR